MGLKLPVVVTEDVVDRKFMQRWLRYSSSGDNDEIEKRVIQKRGNN